MTPSTAIEAPAAPTRSARLRTESLAAHRDAAGGGFLGRAFDGSMTRDDYVAFVGQIRHVYLALEAAGDVWSTDAGVGQFARADLARSDLLADDLRALLGPTWETEGAPALSETATYVAHLRTRAVDDPIVFLAHHYTRLLGDLSGGQMIGRRIESLLELDASSGTSWFHFDSLDTDEAKSWYRDQLDELDLNPAEEQVLLDEVLAAYAMNASLLAGLESARVGDTR